MLPYLLAALLAVLLILAPLGYAATYKKPALLLAQSYQPHYPVAAYLVSEKLDGVRAYWDGSKLLTRSGNLINAPDWFLAALPATPLDGELWMGRGQFDRVSSLVRRQTTNTEDWQTTRYMVFDLPAYPGTFSQRYDALYKLVETANANWLRPVEQRPVHDHETLNTTLAEVVAEGGEGLMLHRADAIYIPTRNDSLLKLKPRYDAEAKVLAHLPGKGKYHEMTGALLVELASGRRS